MLGHILCFLQLCFQFRYLCLKLLPANQVTPEKKKKKKNLKSSQIPKIAYLPHFTADLGLTWASTLLFQYTVDSNLKDDDIT